MLGSLRDSAGAPSVRTRAVALLILVGLVVLTAPIVVLPLARAIGNALF